MGTVTNQQLQDKFDEDHEKGYRGARVDPNPNSAYSQESDPTTSPGSGEFWHGENFVVIDQYADEDDPHRDKIYGDKGLDGPSLGELDAGDDDASDLVEDTDIQGVAPAQATAGQGRTTEFRQDVPYDGVVAHAKITAVANISSSVDPNNRTFKVHNATKNKDIATFKTSSALAAGAPTDMTLTANTAVSLGDDLQLIEVANGTGQAHGGVSVKVTVHQDND